MALGAATTIIGYATLALSPFPGLKQVAVFSAVGLGGSLATVMLWFPLLDRTPRRQLHPAALAAAGALWRLWRGRRWRWLVAALATVTVAGAFRLEPDDDMRRQQGLSPLLAAEQAEIQRLAGFGQTGQFFLVKGGSVSQVLEREEALGERLAGRAGWQSVARYVPSAKRQAENAALAERALYAPALDDYRARLGMAETYRPAPPEHPLALADIRAASALPFLDTLVVDPGLHVVTLDAIRDLAAVAAAADGIDGVRFVDPTADLNALLRAYRLRALALLAVSVAAMAPLLAWRYGWRGAVGVLAPAVAAVAATPPLLALAGIGFSFFAAMALVLVLSIGTDYALFCAEDGSRDPVTLVSVCLAMLTTLLSFGLLAGSGVAAVRAFGATMLAGVALAFVLAPSVQGRQARNSLSRGGGG
jgi:predicted exporter